MSRADAVAGAPKIAADPRYPIGTFSRAAAYSVDERERAVELISELPERLYNAVNDLTNSQIDTPYRTDGWTVRQLVHHIADSHMHAFTRIRYALTEARPVIRAYDEKAWAELPDALTAPAAWSLELIESLHGRWVVLLEQIRADQWQCAYIHPENGPTTIEQAVQLYAWHGRHHVAHITHLRAARGW